ncbi:MAG TPA: ECF-type sigma factor [Usitatibacteraceae bacterium]
MTEQVLEKPAREYNNEGQQRILELARLLAGNEFAGLTNVEIAKAMGISAPMVHRDLWNLEKAGYAEQIPETGRWRLGPRLMQIATAFSVHVNRQRAVIDQIEQRYTRQP